jgi:hypothetical protein
VIHPTPLSPFTTPNKLVPLYGHLSICQESTPPRSLWEVKRHSGGARCPTTQPLILGDGRSPGAAVKGVGATLCGASAVRQQIRRLPPFPPREPDPLTLLKLCEREVNTRSPFILHPIVASNKEGTQSIVRPRMVLAAQNELSSQHLPHLLRSRRLCTRRVVTIFLFTR